MPSPSDTDEALGRLARLAERLEWGGVGEHGKMPSRGDLEDAKALRAALDLIAALKAEKEEAEDRGVGVGMVIAAAIIVRTWGEDVQAEEILNAAGITDMAAMRKFGVDAYDASALRGVLRTIAEREKYALQSKAQPHDH